jgi:hypothetical protein
MPRLIAAVIIIALFVALVVYVFNWLSKRLSGSSETVGKVLATIIIAAAAYALFGQHFLFGYLE